MRNAFIKFVKILEATLISSNDVDSSLPNSVGTGNDDDEGGTHKSYVRWNTENVTREERYLDLPSPFRIYAVLLARENVLADSCTGDNPYSPNGDVMFKHVLFLASLLLIVGSLGTRAQSGWVVQSPLPTPISLSDVHYASANTYFAVGWEGVILKTTDDGTTWTIQSRGTTRWLSSVFFVDADIGIAVGDSGTILRTTDGGETWTRQESGKTYTLTSVSFANANVGMAVGTDGTIIHTFDGGATWSPLPISISGTLNSVHFIDTNTCTVVGEYGNILRTTNGGSTWSYRGTGRNDLFLDVYFSDTNTGIVAGQDSLARGLVLRTTDGGTSWERESGGDLERVGGEHVSSIAFSDDTVGLAIFWGNVIRTTDGGQTWSSRLHEKDVYAPEIYLNAITYGGSRNWMAVGRSGAIIRTTDGGGTWIRCFKGTTRTLNDVYFTSTNVGNIVTRTSHFMRTTDGGSTWTSLLPGIPGSVSRVSFADSTRGIAVGPGGMIHRTVDAGRTWSYRGVTRDDLGNVAFLGASTWTAVGSNGTILRSTDDGETWMRQPSGSSKRFWCIAFSDVRSGIVIGSTILRTTDGGETWKDLDTSGKGYFEGWGVMDASFTDANTGTVVGWEGRIYRTTNGGMSWSRQFSGATAILYSVHFSDINTGTAVGSSGTILRTTDGGSTWNHQSYPASGGQLYRVFFTDANTGTIVGAGGIILRTTTGGVVTSVIEVDSTSVSDTPVQHTLEQSYPNPASDMATIRFRIQSQGAVDLDLFDGANNKVAVLVHQQMQPGTYTVTFSTTLLSSGAYNYRLQTGDVVETKSMIILR